MKAILILALVLPAAAAGGGGRCPDGTAPALTGDILIPLRCGPQGGALPELGPEPAPTSGPFARLAGRWEGTFTRGTGRYAAVLTIKKTAGGGEAVLEAKELQMRDQSAVKAVFTLESPGRYKAVLSSPASPGAVLRGTATFGAGKARVKLAEAEHEADFSLSEKDGSLGLVVRSALRGASQPVAFEARLARAKPAR